MSTTIVAIKYAFAVVFLGVSAYFLYSQAVPYLQKPCEEPLTYTVALFDERFNITRTELDTALVSAARVWNEAAGKEIITLAKPGTTPDIPVRLVYGTDQKNSELGETIDAEQTAYERQKAAVERLREEFTIARVSYESRADSFDTRAAKYHESVAYWNAKGGAPEKEYQTLSREQERLAKEQEELQELARNLNALSERINEAVDTLNALAKKLNAKVGAYNERAGEDFDQGRYQRDEAGARIEIFQFDSKAELTRVLAHEFGHALDIGHVENPTSLMYSYDIGTDLALSPEDLAALRAACELDQH